MENIFASKMKGKSDLELQEIIENRFDYQEEAYSAALYEIEIRRKAKAQMPAEPEEAIQNKQEHMEEVEEDDDEHKSFSDVMEALVPAKKYFITPIIIYLNILIYIVMVLAGVHPMEPSVDDLITWGGNLRELTLLGEQWRLLSNVFLHGGVFHLLFNMYALLFIGKEIETQIGSSRSLFAYLVTGILASIASIGINYNIVSVGASGAIFGMYGLLIALLALKAIDLPKATRKNFVTSVLFFVGYNLLFGFKEEGIDNAAHIGGLISGVIMGGIYYLGMNNARATKAIYVASSLVIFMVIMILPKLVPNNLGNYSQLMEEFASAETEALSISELEPNASADKYLKTIQEDGIPNWLKCRSILNQVDSIENLPLELQEQNKLFKRYCDYRIESFRLMEKSIIEQTNQYDFNIEEYTEKIDLIIKKLEGESIADSALVINTLLASDKEPLYVLDGVPVSSKPDIKPEKVESMEVLKDDAAIQLYGSRGKNGVILINTKQ